MVISRTPELPNVNRCPIGFWSGKYFFGRPRPRALQPRCSLHGFEKGWADGSVIGARPARPILFQRARQQDSCNVAAVGDQGDIRHRRRAHAREVPKLLCQSRRKKQLGPRRCSPPSRHLAENVSSRSGLKPMVTECRWRVCERKRPRRLPAEAKGRSGKPSASESGRGAVGAFGRFSLGLP